MMRLFAAVLAGCVLAEPAFAEDTRLSTNCKLFPYSLVCAGYDRETAKRMIDEEDARRAREAQRAAAEHEANQKAKQSSRARAAAWAAAVKAGNTSPIAAVPPGSKWHVTVGLSKFDDTLQVLAVLNAEETIRVRIGSPRPKFVVRCKEDTTSLYLDWGVFVHTERRAIEYRIDKRSKYEDRWHVSSDHQATGLWSGQDAIPFLKELAGAKDLLVRVTPYGESPVTAEFSLPGVDEVIRNVRTACAW